jgi:hypothetical protein
VIANQGLVLLVDACLMLLGAADNKQQLHEVR